MHVPSRRIIFQGSGTRALQPEINKKTDLAVSHKGAMFSESACMTIFGTLGIVLGNKVLIIIKI